MRIIFSIVKRVQENIDVEEAIKSSYLYLHPSHPNDESQVDFPIYI